MLIARLLRLRWRYLIERVKEPGSCFSRTPGSAELPQIWGPRKARDRPGVPVWTGSESRFRRRYRNGLDDVYQAPNLATLETIHGKPTFCTTTPYRLKLNLVSNCLATPCSFQLPHRIRGELGWLPERFDSSQRRHIRGSGRTSSEQGLLHRYSVFNCPGVATSCNLSTDCKRVGLRVRFVVTHC